MQRLCRRVGEGYLGDVAHRVVLVIMVDDRNFVLSVYALQAVCMKGGDIFCVNILINTAVGDF